MNRRAVGVVRGTREATAAGGSDITCRRSAPRASAAANIAITYVGLVDTRFNDRHGVEGVIGSDAALNLIGVVILGLVFWRLGSFGKWRHPAEPAPAAPAAPS
jgi:hypothetical protein